MGFDIRSKPKTLDSKPTSCSELPIWNYDGSSTGQAPGADSEVLLRPVAIFDDPFRGGDNVLLLCETLTPAMEPIPTNTRAAAKAIFDQKLDEKPWFGIEQEYTLYELDKKTPLGWPVGGFPGPQGPYYCSAGADVSFGRNVKVKHSEHIAAYGEGNERRLTGAHETAPITEFSYGVANRGASVRIPRTAEASGCGYFEDRRPASNMDPYVVTSKIFKTTVLG